VTGCSLVCINSSDCTALMEVCLSTRHHFLWSSVLISVTSGPGRTLKVMENKQNVRDFMAVSLKFWNRVCAFSHMRVSLA